MEHALIPLPVSAPSPEPAHPWQQPDLLGLLSPPPCPQPPAIAPDSGAALRGKQASVAVSSSADTPGSAVVQGSSGQEAPTSPSLPPLCAHSRQQVGSAAAPPPATLLILDAETTALTPAAGQCVEVGAILFAVAPRAVLTQVSFLLPVPINPAQAINGIDAATSRLRQPWQAALQCFEAMLAAADAVLAHNAAFDRQWFGRPPLPPVNVPWICSMDDIRWPADRGLRANPSVRDLSLAYGVPVWAAHRALTDCIYLAQVLERCDPLEQLLLEALEPRRLFRACLSYAERQQAKEAGFRWNDPVPGAWTRRLSDREARELAFSVQPVDAGAGQVVETAA